MCEIPNKKSNQIKSIAMVTINKAKRKAKRLEEREIILRKKKDEAEIKGRDKTRWVTKNHENCERMNLKKEEYATDISTEEQTNNKKKDSRLAPSTVCLKVW